MAVNKYLELMRYRNCAMAGLAAVIGAAIAYNAVPGELSWIGLIFVTVFLITGSGNAINDYFDAEIDAINRPDRPIPSGRISRKSALGFSILLFITGIVMSYFIGSNQIPFFIAVFNSFLLYSYASFLKKKVFIGNLSVSYLTGSTFLFGGAAYGGRGIQLALILFFLSMLATFAREIVKTIEDIDGDRKNGALTLPIVIGERRSAYIACLSGIISIAFSPLPFLLEMFNKYYLLLVGIADMIFLYAMFMILKKDPAASSRYFKIGMFFALLSFVAGSFLTRI